MLVKIFTDGAARGNPDGPGGYGVILQYVDRSGSFFTKLIAMSKPRFILNIVMTTELSEV